MDKLENDVIAYYCIIKPHLAERWTNGHTHIKLENFVSVGEEIGIEPMQYIHFSEVVWAECSDGSRFCYKSRQIPKEKMTISDEAFVILKLISKSC